jgi:hypothetical protein
MSLRMDVSPLHRLVVIVAAGKIAAEEVSSSVEALIKANVPGYAKMIDVSHASSDMTGDQVTQVATLLRTSQTSATHGPVAFIINPERPGFARMFADLIQGELPIRLFRSIHQARAWLAEAQSSTFGRRAI